MRIFFLLMLSFPVFAQETSKNNFTGSWRVNGSWIDNSFPNNAALGGGNITINGYITLGTPTVSQNLIINNNTDAFDFILNDTLVVFGNVDFPNTGMDLVIGNGGLLIVFGNFTLGNQMDVASTGNVVVTGTFTKSGSAIQGSYTGGGNVYAGTFSIPGTWVPAADQKNTGSDLQNDLRDVYDFIQGGGSGTLPVELLYFKIDDNKNNVLRWATATQVNFSHFEIEHSKNGEDWNTLGEIIGAGNTNEFLSYSFEHLNPANGNNYYRLKMVDLDDTFEYSSIIKSVSNQRLTFDVYPNPVTNRSLTFVYHFELGANDRITFYDLSGNAILQTAALDFTGKVTLPESIMPGTYFLQFKSASNQVTITKRVVIQ